MSKIKELKRPSKTLDGDNLNRMIRQHNAMSDNLARLVGAQGLDETAHKFLGVIHHAGPDADSDYTDERYWVKSAYISNSSAADGAQGIGDQITTTAFPATHSDGKSTGAFWVTASNLAERGAGTHYLPPGTRVWVIEHGDNQTPRRPHYVFSLEPVTIPVPVSHEICRPWFLYNAATANPPVFRQVDLYLGHTGTGTPVGVQCPWYGKATRIIMNTTDPGSHTGGVVDYIIYDATTGGAAPQTDAPQKDNLNPSTDQYGSGLSDGLTVSAFDMLELWCRATINPGNISVEVLATFVIEETAAYRVTGAATDGNGVSPNGIYLLNGKWGTSYMSCKRTDGAFWLFNTVTGWTVSYVRTDGAMAAYWSNAATLEATYTPSGTATGNLTVAAV